MSTCLNLDRLREVTGVFISESDFQAIQLSYIKRLEENALKDTDDVAELYCEQWKEFQENIGTFKETKDGIIKYYCPFEKDEPDMTAQEFLNKMDMNSYHYENLCRSYWNIFEEILKTGNVDKRLIENILAERALSFEQASENMIRFEDSYIKI